MSHSVMRPRGAAAAVAAAAALVLTLSACGSDDSMAEKKAGTAPSSSSSATMKPSPGSTGSMQNKDTMKPGAYLSLADYKSMMSQRTGTKVVYFFHASWCPNCRATDDSLTKDGVPQGLTVVKVDYDAESELKKMYGVTQQHTFVEVDPSGKELARWSGTKTGAEIKAKTV